MRAAQPEDTAVAVKAIVTNSVRLRAQVAFEVFAVSVEPISDADQPPRGEDTAPAVTAVQPAGTVTRTRSRTADVEAVVFVIVSANVVGTSRAMGPEVSDEV